MALAEIVINNSTVPGGLQFLYDNAADISGPPATRMLIPELIPKFPFSSFVRSLLYTKPLLSRMPQLACKTQQ